MAAVTVGVMDASGARAPCSARRCRRRPARPRDRRAGARGGGDGGRRRARPPRAHRRGRRPRSAPSGWSAREAALAEAAAVDAVARPRPRCRWPACRSRSRTTSRSPVRSVTDGSPAAPSAPAAEDHPVVARLRAAGAVVVGITRAPELCLYAATDGPGTVTRNPWDTARSPAGQLRWQRRRGRRPGSVPLAHGNDGMGSLRLPAAACGLVTLKPGRGVVARPGSASTTGRAWRSTARWPPRWPTSRLAHAVLAGRARRRRRPTRRGRCGSRVSTRSPVPGRPGRRRRRAPRSTPWWRCSRAAGHTVVRRDPPITAGAAAGALARWMAGAARRRRAPRASTAPSCSRAAAPTPASAGSCAGPGWSGRARRSGSARAWPRSSTTSTCCSPRSPPGRRCPPAPGTSGRSWPTSRPTRAGRRGRRPGTWPACPAVVLPAGDAARGAAGRRPVRRTPRRRGATTLAGRRAGTSAAVAPPRAGLRPHRRPPPRPPDAPAGAPVRVTGATPRRAGDAEQRLRAVPCSGR